MVGISVDIRVLCVDDDVDHADLTATALERDCHRIAVETAHGTEAGLAALADGRFDCVVSDYEMPGRDGLDFLSAVRRDYPTLPFILFTATDAAEVANEALDRGATDYLQKSGGAVQYDLLANRIENAVERYRASRRAEAVERAGHAVMLTDVDGTIEYVNDAFEETTGYTAGEALGETPALLKSGEHDEPFYRELWETVLDGEVWEGEVINERADGERYVVDQTIAPIDGAGSRASDAGDGGRDGGAGDGGRDGGDSDTVTGFVAVTRDVTERKERELNLTALKRAIDQAGIGIGTYGADGYPTYVNHSLADLFGVDREQLRDQHMADLDPELDRDRFDAYWDSFDDGERRIYDTRVARPDGDEFPAEVVTSRATIDGEPYQVTTVRDVTDRKQRERQLERFRSAVEHAGHGVLITDADGTIEYVNDAFESTSGYSAAEAIGQTPALLKSGEHDEAFYRELWETVLDGEVWDGEVVNERADGERYVVDQTIAPIADTDDISGFVAVNRDITDLKQYERELEAQNERLREYGHTVAHDIRNPLNLLRGELDTLRVTAERADESVPVSAVGERCDRLTDIVERMETLVDELLTLAEQGQLVLDPQSVALTAVAEEAWEQQATAAADLAVEGGTVDADRDRLRELLTNLFRNALEHGGRDVAVRVGPLDFADGFYVEDDGPGIPPDDRDSVLERGYTTADDGTGFGLAIVAQIAEGHGWSVSITDGSEGGARFEFRADSG